MADWLSQLKGSLQRRRSRRDFLRAVGGVAAGSAAGALAGRSSAGTDPARHSRDAPDASPSEITCGGSRSGTCSWDARALGLGIISVSLAGSAFSDVSVISPSELRAVWRSTCLVGTATGLGTAVMTYQRPAESTVTITSNQPSGQPFFPAQASQRLFYTISILDPDGDVTATWDNLTPMRMTADISDLPPFGAAFTITENVTFYDTSASPPQPAMVIRKGGTGLVNDPGGLTVTLANVQINKSTGQFSLTAQIATTPGRTPPPSFDWFITGYGTAEITSAPYALNVPGPGAAVPVTGTFQPGTSGTGLVVNAFSGTAWEGNKALRL